MERFTRHVFGAGYYHHKRAAVMAMAAVEMAMWDAQARACGQPLSALWGGVFRNQVKASAYLFGTDAAIYPHGQNARQFAVMVEYGMTPAEAIRAATWNAAQALGREGDVGAIVAGRYGDLIAVSGDPLADVRMLETVPVVIKGGAVVRDAR